MYGVICEDKPGLQDIVAPPTRKAKAKQAEAESKKRMQSELREAKLEAKRLKDDLRAAKGQCNAKPEGSDRKPKPDTKKGKNKSSSGDTSKKEEPKKHEPTDYGKAKKAFAASPL